MAVFPFRTLSVLGALCVFGQTVAASAQGSITVIGALPTALCAAAAAADAPRWEAGRDDMDTCNRAVSWARSMHRDVAPTLLNRGVLHLARREYDAAIADFTHALDEGADAATALNDRGIAEVQLQRYAEADADYTEALAHQPAHPETVYFNRAVNDENLGNIPKAYADYLQAARAAPQWDKPQQELARFHFVQPSLS